MTTVDILVAILVVAIGPACLVAVARMTSGLGRLGLLLVLLLAVLIGLGCEPPSWQQITDYFAPTTTEVNR
jgi:hypothetical protein